MGEKKRRLAAGGKSSFHSDAILDKQLARYREDCAALEQAIAANAGDHEAAYRLSTLRLLMSAIVKRQVRNDASKSSGENLNQALDAITHALKLQPAVDRYWTHFAECISQATLSHPLDPRARDTLARALDHPATQPLALIGPIIALVRSGPAVMAFENLPYSNIGIDTLADAAQANILLTRIDEILEEPLLLRLFELTIVPDPSIERLILRTRRAVLGATTIDFAEPASSPLPLAALAAIAQQCFATEYVYEVSPQEEIQIAALVEAIESRRTGGDGIPMHWIAVLACYRPLHTLKDAQGLRDSLGATELNSLLKTQILEPTEEKNLCENLGHTDPADSTGIADNPVSIAVGSLYEAHPYPRWLKTVRVPSEGGLREHLRQLIPHAAPLTEDRSRPCILVAGCGTGQQSIETAQRYRDAQVLAIDLSATSLAYAQRKTLELGLDNIEYRQCDILGLASLQERFDYIESIGVLHHLEDPLRGWRVLRDLLRPKGIMRIGLYSEIARQELTPLIEMVSARGLKPDLEGIRRCRAEVRMAFGASHFLNSSPDFYCASGVRDMLFHVMEHRYTWPQIGVMIEQLDLEFLGIHLPGIDILDRYRAAFPDDPSLRNMDNWHRFETENPWMFRSLYKFWVQARS